MPCKATTTGAAATSNAASTTTGTHAGASGKHATTQLPNKVNGVGSDGTGGAFNDSKSTYNGSMRGVDAVGGGNEGGVGSNGNGKVAAFVRASDRASAAFFCVLFF